MTESLFDGFTPAEIALVRSAGTQVHLPTGWAPIAETTPADKAYLILSGEVSVRKRGEEVATVGAGSIIGEAAIVNHTLRTASVVALTELDLLHFGSDQLIRLRDEIPAFRRALEQTAAARLTKS